MTSNTQQMLQMWAIILMHSTTCLDYDQWEWHILFSKSNTEDYDDILYLCIQVGVNVKNNPGSNKNKNKNNYIISIWGLRDIYTHSIIYIVLHFKT